MFRLDYFLAAVPTCPGSPCAFLGLNHAFSTKLVLGKGDKKISGNILDWSVVHLKATVNKQIQQTLEQYRYELPDPLIRR